jgi:predicted GNAT family N-acyltransferase
MEYVELNHTAGDSHHITKKWIIGNGDLAQIHDIRRIVFLQEQNVSEEDEMIVWEDEASEHLIIFENGAPVATGRVVLHEGKFSLGRIAVLKEHRGKGLGKLVTAELIERAFAMGATEIEIHAQSYAKEFYGAFGFEVVSDEYEEAGIMHFTMLLRK